MKKENSTLCRVGIIIATKGRPDAIPQVLRLLEAQTLRPDIVIISAHEKADVGFFESFNLNVGIVFGPAGSSQQRNLGMEAILHDTDIIIFFDDDFAPSANWVERCVDAFYADNTVVGLTGIVIKDGAKSKGPAVTWDEALKLIDGYKTALISSNLTVPCTSLYGCNMAFRSSRIGKLRFDERLVLYGWLEDTDFSRRMATRGRLVQAHTNYGVHLAIRSGRVSGKKFGYSQIVNPWYLCKKGVLTKKQAFRNMRKSFVKNLIKSFRPEAHLDSRGRLSGNLIGMLELLSGKCRPERAAQL